MTLFLCKVQIIYTLVIQKLTIVIYNTIRGFIMEKNEIIRENDEHVIFIDRLTDHHIEVSNLPKVEKKDKKKKKPKKNKKNK